MPEQSTLLNQAVTSHAVTPAIAVGARSSPIASGCSSIDYPAPPLVRLSTGVPVASEWLRLVSALLVVVCHFAALYAAVFHAFDVDSATFNSAPSAVTTALTALYFQFHGAYVFFAISGFVITRPWFASAQTPAATSFPGRRAFRLVASSDCCNHCSRVLRLLSAQLQAG